MARLPALALLLCLPLPVAAAEILEVKLKPTHEKGTFEMEALARVDARPAALRWVVTRLCQYPQTTRHLSYCRIYRVDGTKAWSYAVVDPPILDPRDYVIVSEVTEDLAPDGTGTYVTSWKLVTDEGPPARPGVLRLQRNEGSWHVQSLEGGKKTLLRYSIKVAPGGNIPSRAAGYVQQVTLPDYLGMLETLANEEDKRGVVPVPGPTTMWSGVDVKPLVYPLPSARR